MVDWTPTSNSGDGVRLAGADLKSDLPLNVNRFPGEG